jgi:ABC-type multidrug transport system ATPase subunit
LTQISLYAAIRGVGKDEARIVGEERLKKVRLWDRRKGRVGVFSGGMRRRLSMVLSTIGDPKLVILDEVTTGLDPVSTIPRSNKLT